MRNGKSKFFNDNINDCSTSNDPKKAWTLPGEGGGYLTKFDTGGSAPRSDPLTFGRKGTLLYTFYIYWKKLPLLHTYL